jgi:hypothetical protein
VIRPADRFQVPGSDHQRHAFEWNGPVKKGERRIASHLIAQDTSGSRDALACARLAENVAALALPRPAPPFTSD